MNANKRECKSSLSAKNAKNAKSYDVAAVLPFLRKPSFSGFAPQANTRLCGNSITIIFAFFAFFADLACLRVAASIC